MTPYELEMLRSLREEIAFFGLSQLLITLSMTILLVLIFVACQHDRFRSASLIVPFLVASALFAVGRTDLLMHRAAAYIRTLEQLNGGRLGWEHFKTGLVQTQILPVYDVLALSVWGFVLIWAYRSALTLLDSVQYRRFVWGTSVLIVMSVVSIVYGATAR